MCNSVIQNELGNFNESYESCSRTIFCCKINKELKYYNQTDILEKVDTNFWIQVFSEQIKYEKNRCA